MNSNKISVSVRIDIPAPNSSPNYHPLFIIFIYYYYSLRTREKKKNTLSLSPQNPNPRIRRRRWDGVGDAVPHGGGVPGGGGGVRAGRARGGAGLAGDRRLRREARPPPLLRHRLGRRPLGHLHRGHHHVQELAEAPVRESAEQDVSGVLHVGLSLHGSFRGGIRLPPPVEVGLFIGALPARVSPRRPRLRSLQPPRLHSHDYRDDEEEAQNRERSEHRRRSRMV